MYNIIKEEPYGTIERIKELMDKRGLTQQAFADLIGVNIRSVTRWFSGTPIRKSNLATIAEKMECDVEFLECTQDIAKKNPSGHTVKLSPVSITDRYLPMIQKIMITTTQRFTYNIGFTGESYEIVQGAFIENNVRYHYETLHSTGNGEMFYWVTLSDGSRIKKTETEMKDFVNDIMKFISYKISNLSD